MADGSIKIDVDIEIEKAEKELIKVKKKLTDVKDEAEKDTPEITVEVEVEEPKEVPEIVVKAIGKIDEIELPDLKKENWAKIDIPVDIEQTTAEDSLKLLQEEAKLLGEDLQFKDQASIEKLAIRFESLNNDIEETREKLAEATNKLSEFETAGENLVHMNTQLRETQDIYNQMRAGGAELFDGTDGEYLATLDQLTSTIRTMESGIVDANNEFKKLGTQENLVNAVNDQNKALNRMNLKYKTLDVDARTLTNRIFDSTKETTKLDTETKRVSKSMKNTSKSAGNMTNGISKGISKLGKYALALFSIRTAYQTLRKLSNQWLNSDDAGAKQVKANIQAMSSALSNALAPVITYIANLMATVFGYVNAILKAFFGIDLLAKKTSKNTSGIASGTKKARKEAERFSSAIDKADIATGKISENLDGGGGGAGMDLPAPKLPELEVPKWISKLMDDLKPFIDTIKSIDFDPLVKSFQRFTTSLKGLTNVVYDSFIRLMNNAIAPFVKIMLEEIRPRMFNGLAEAIDMLTPHVDWLLQNLIEPLAQFLLLDLVPASLNLLLALFELLIPVTDAFMEGIKSLIGILTPFASILGGMVLVALELVTRAVEWLTDELNKEDSAIKDIIKVIGFLVGIYATVKTSMFVVGGVVAGLTKVVAVLTAGFGKVLAIVKLVAGFFAGAFTGAILPIIALVTLLGTMLVGLVTNFEQVKNDFMVIVGNIKGILDGLVNFVVGVFTGNWKRAFQGLVDIVRNIFSGFVNIIKFPINVLIDGLNFFIRQLNKIKIPTWVPGVGGKGINLPPIQRLARGGFASSGSMQAIIGENGSEVALPLTNNVDAWANPLSDILSSKIGSGGDENINLIVDGNVLARVTRKEEEKRNILVNGVAYGIS